MTSVDRTLLSRIERERLDEEEAAIELGGQQINAALANIRDERLYRESYATFEDYCQQRWNLTRSAVNRRILAIEVGAVLEPMGATVNSRQARALSGLDPDEQRATYARAQEQSGSETPTAKQITAARPQDSGIGADDSPPVDDPAPDTEAAGVGDAAVDAPAADEPAPADDEERTREAEEQRDRGLAGRVPDSEKRQARAKLRAHWSTAISGAAGIPVLNVEKVLDALTPAELAAARLTFTNLRKWSDRLEAVHRRRSMRLVSEDQP